MAGPSTPVDTPLGDLIRRIAEERDRTAFRELFEAIGPRIKGYMVRQGTDGSTAEEILQEVMLAVWRRAETFDPRLASATTWIFTIARNKRIDCVRRDRRADWDSDDPALVPDILVPGADAALESSRDGAALREAIQALPAEQADMLRMAFYQDKSHRAIAEETRIPLGTVKSRIRLALVRLRDVLEKR